MKLFLIDGRYEEKATGIGRYVRFLFAGLATACPDLNISYEKAIPNRLLKIRLARWIKFFISVPVSAYRSNPSLIFAPKQRIPFFLPVNIPVVVTIHDLCYKNVPDSMMWSNRLINQIFIPYAIKKATLVIAVSQNTAKEIAEYFPECRSKIRVTGLAACEMEQARSYPDASGLAGSAFVLFVGTIEPRKNLTRLIAAYSKLPQTIKNSFSLVIAGGYGWGKINLAEQITSLGLQNHVILKSYINDVELAELYKQAYCLTMPSLYEGFGLPILEAQSLGVPVVTSNVASMPEVAGEGAVLVDPFSVNSIKNGLEKILSDKSLREQLSIKAKENAAKYSWNQTAHLTMKVFKEAIKIKADCTDGKYH